jgi:hypothetical protein
MQLGRMQLERMQLSQPYRNFPEGPNQAFSSHSAGVASRKEEIKVGNSCWANQQQKYTISLRSRFLGQLFLCASSAVYIMAGKKDFHNVSLICGGFQLALCLSK